MTRTLSVLFTLMLLNLTVTFAQQQEIIIYTQDEQLPAGAKYIKDIRIGDRMRFNCGYSETLEMAKEKAREAGANMLQIAWVKSPDISSTCYRIKTRAYYAENPGAMDYSDTLTSRLIFDTAKYALLYIYREDLEFGKLDGYDVHANGMVFPMGNNMGYITKIEKEGELLAWAKSEKRSEVRYDIKFGKVYFLNCRILFGMLQVRPELEAVDIRHAYYKFSRTNPGYEPIPESEYSKKKRDNLK